MDRDTAKRYRDEASEDLERRASSRSTRPTDQHLRMLLDPRDGRIIALADALLDVYDDASKS